MQAFMWESVLKCKFSDYSGVVRPTDQETTAIEKTVCYTHRWEEEGHATPCRATPGSTSVAQKAEGVRGKHGQGSFCGFYGKERVRQHKQA